MILVKILKRRDASSVIVAILIAMVVSQPLYMFTARLAGIISGLEEGQYFSYTAANSGWQEMYLYPVTWIVVQLAVLEVLCWLYVGARTILKRR